MPVFFFIKEGKMKNRFTVLLCAFCLVSLLSVPVFGGSGENGDTDSPEITSKLSLFDSDLPRLTWGTGTPIMVTLGSYEFDGYYSNSILTGVAGETTRYFESGPSYAIANPHIPIGAVLYGIGIKACDFSGTGQLTVSLYSESIISYGIDEEYHGGISTGTAYNSGCYFFTNYLSPYITVDNINRTYAVQLYGSESSSNLRFLSVHLFYYLQVSPAPSTNTFSDVLPTHQFFQYIEALAASGITVGYDDGTFRPNNYVTRAQMAAFLSKALGLHWPY
jgi:hypothetical protein